MNVHPNCICKGRTGLPPKFLKLPLNYGIRLLCGSDNYRIDAVKVLNGPDVVKVLSGPDGVYIFFPSLDTVL
jgi:hypothetical protein